MVNLLESINVQTNAPLDSRTVVKTLSNRDAISTTVRYLGMKVYVSDEKKEYRLEDGIENSHWKEIKGVTNLSEMVSDNNHMTVSKTEKDKWDGKAEGNHNHDTVYAKTSHKHNASEVTGLPTALKNPTALTIQLNGKNDVVYDGSVVKSVNITAAGIGAQPSGNYAQATHTHVAIDINQDSTHRMVSDTQIKNWNDKADGNHIHKAETIDTSNAFMFVSLEEKDKWNLKAEGDHNHDGKYPPFVHIHLAEEIKETEEKRFISKSYLDKIDILNNNLVKTITFDSGEANSFKDGEKIKTYKCLIGSDFPIYPEIKEEFLNDFFGWKIEPYSDILNNKVNIDVKLTALYKRPLYVITFKCNEGGMFEESQSDTLVKYIFQGEKIEIPKTIVPISYEFSYWTPNLDENTISTKNETFTANFNFLGIDVDLDDSGKLFEKKSAKNDEYKHTEYENSINFSNENIIILK